MEPFRWWAAQSALGFLALPWALRLFPHLPDRGLLFARPLGLLSFTYLFWAIGLTGVHAPDRSLALGLFVVLAPPSLLLLWRERRALRSTLANAWPLLLGGELLYLALFAFWTWVRSLWPDINHTEQPMDFAFLNAVLRAERFPPHDPWLAGCSMAYYHFGYLMAATLVHLTAVAPAVAYNLALANTAALAGVGAFGLAAGLMRARGLSWALASGVLAASLLLFLANLEGVLELVFAHGQGSPAFWAWIGIKGLDQPAPSPAWYSIDTWWWRASRIIDTVVAGESLDYTITEFPFFSFFLGDLHPHVMGLPVLYLATAVALQGWHGGLAWPQVVLAGLVVGGAGFTNAWDLPLAAGLMTAGAIGGILRGDRAASGPRVLPPTLKALLVLVLAGLLYAPFWLAFRGPVFGLLPVVSAGTRPLHGFLHWGPLAFGALANLVPALMTSPAKRAWRWTALVLGTLAAFWLVASSASFALQGNIAALPPALLTKAARAWWWLVPLAAALAAFTARARSEERGPSFGLFLAVAAFLLIGGAELFFVLDLFGTRMNTVFKLSYQSWALLAVASACGLLWTASLRPRALWQHLLKALWALSAAIALLSGLVYPVAVLIGLESDRNERTLDGLAWLARTQPDEAAAIQWLQDTVRGAPVIVEAVGPSYSSAARISARTGLPTVLGWPGHESQWRSAAEVIRAREQDVARLYESGDPQLIRTILDRYRITYVVVGEEERGRYGSAGLAALEALLEPVFRRDHLTIYRVPYPDQEPAHITPMR